MNVLRGLTMRHHLLLNLIVICITILLTSCVGTLFRVFDPFDVYSPHENPKHNQQTNYNQYHARQQHQNINNKYMQDNVQYLDLKERIFRSTNAERVRRGLPPLKSISILKKIADKRAIEISYKFSHSRPNGASWEQLLEEYNIHWRACAENIAYGQESAEEVMTSWMNSPGHRANILGNNYEYIGIGVYQKNGTLYWTQDFLTFR